MGNCLVRQDKVVKIMKIDGKILEYQTPLRVHQVLSEFSADHVICDALQVNRHLGLDSELLRGHLYYLLPPPLAIDARENKTLNESNLMVDAELRGTPTSTTNTALRIKLVISKQQLKEMLIKGGVSSSVDDMISQIQNKERSNKVCFVDDEESCRGWKPMLDSIPE